MLALEDRIIEPLDAALVTEAKRELSFSCPGPLFQKGGLFIFIGLEDRDDISGRVVRAWLSVNIALGQPHCHLTHHLHR